MAKIDKRTSDGRVLRNRQHKTSRLESLHSAMDGLVENSIALTERISSFIQLPDSLLGLFVIASRLKLLSDKVVTLAISRHLEIDALIKWVDVILQIATEHPIRRDMLMSGVRDRGDGFQPPLHGLYDEHPIWCALWFSHNTEPLYDYAPLESRSESDMSSASVANGDKAEIYRWLQAQMLAAYIELHDKLPSNIDAKSRLYQAGLFVRTLQYAEYDEILSHLSQGCDSPSGLQAGLLAIRSMDVNQPLKQGCGAFAELMGYAYSLCKDIFREVSRRKRKKRTVVQRRSSQSKIYPDHTAYWHFLDMGLMIDGKRKNVDVLCVSLPSQRVRSRLSVAGVADEEYQSDGDLEVNIDALLSSEGVLGDIVLQGLLPLQSLYAIARAKSRMIAMDVQRFMTHPDRIRRGPLRNLLLVMSDLYEKAHKKIQHHQNLKESKRLVQMLESAAIALVTGTYPEISISASVISDVRNINKRHVLAYGEKERAWLRHYQGPKRKQLAEYVKANTIDTVSYLVIPDMLSVGRFATDKATEDASKKNYANKKLWNMHIKQALLSKGVEPHWCEWDNLGDILPSWFTGLEEGDQLHVAMLFGRDDPLASTHRHYTSVLLTHLAEYYRSTVGELWNSLDLPRTLGGNHPLFVFQENCFVDYEGCVGDDRVPTVDSIKELLHLIRDDLKDKPSSRLEDVILYHNKIAIYTALGLALTTGFRSVRTPITDLTAIHHATGTMCLQEKDRDDGVHGRAVILPPVMIDQVKRYLEHLRQCHKQHPVWPTRMRVKATKTRDHSLYNTAEYDLDLTKTLFLFELDKHGDWQPIEMTGDRIIQACDEVRKGAWTVDNAGRHFLRTHLDAHRCPVTLLNTLMGHWFYGEESWTCYSALDPVIYRNTLLPYLERMIDEIAYEVVG